MGKGYKRKTRWRTLNIAAPPGEEDDEDGIRDVKPRENGTRNLQHNSGNHKPIHRSETRGQNGVATSESTGAPPSRSQPKIIFDENEYTRITTPRQDVLFKKGYLARKKVWSSNNASTSATPSTTESQSASHSTADGSETTEDQQLLDCRDSGLEEYPSMTEPAAQMSYGTFYDPSTGYYYEYPVMVVGPPMPGPPMHNLLAAMPCEAVPLRPIEWVNPAFVPKLEQPYCLIDYQNPQDGQFPCAGEENGTVENPCTNGTEEPVENGNGSWTGSVAGEEQLEQLEEEHQNGQEETPPSNGEVAPETTYPPEDCLETVLAQQLHVSHHVVPPQPYMYPGHYMFGPTLINVNGMTIQSGPMVRTTDMPAGASMCAKRRKKKKLYRRKPRRPIGQDNNEDYGPEEEEYSSEADNVNLATTPFVPSNRPLNPDCKEFQLRPSTIAESPATPSPMLPEPEPTEPMNLRDLSSDSTTQDTNDSQTDSAAITDVEYATEAIATELNQTHIEESQETEIGVDVTCAEFTDIVEKLEVSKELSNGLSSPLQVSMETIVPNGNDEDCERLSNGAVTDLSPSPEPRELISLKVLASKANSNSRKKYKTTKIVREATPGPELEDETPSGEKPKGLNIEVIMGIEVIEAQVPKSSVSTIGSYINKTTDNQVNEGSNDDSGFESQNRFSEHRITEAVTQWLTRANSPDLFTGLKINDSDNDDDEPDDIEPSKNLQGNPMPALSANSVAINVKTLSRPAGEFATRRRKRNSNKRKKKQLKQLLLKDDCEFPDKDSVVGMRVAKSTRIDGGGDDDDDNDDDDDDDDDDADADADGRKIINNKRTNESIESSRDGVRVITDVDAFKTYEQGEIVVTIDGKLLPTTAVYGGLRRENNLEEGVIEQKSEINSIGSIEEPDVLEYWDVETVEPFVNPNAFGESRGASEPREANEEIDSAGLEIVRKYYRLARNSVQSGSSIDEHDVKSLIGGLRSRLTSPDVIKHFDRQVIDEGIEIYESCYSGKPPIYLDSRFQRSRLFRRDEEGAIPCRVTCCNVQ